MSLSATPTATVQPAVVASSLLARGPTADAPPVQAPPPSIVRAPAKAPSIARSMAAMRADLIVQYQAGEPEQRSVELRFWGEQQQLMAHSRGPREHDSETRLLPLTHDGKRSAVVTALRGLAALYFGPTGLLPRIIGDPDWTTATLTLQSDSSDDAQVLLQVNLRIDGPNGLRAHVRHSMPDVAQAGPVSLILRPGDADPLHALLRVGFGTAPWQLPT
ncbi:hypothetical protein HLB44_14520 [Aquincola sp. S2]|uniref:Uncharacterized protein n=1 Tax=Pseudaquabacterium terrae TaxID=2732868 RepID=A0ABX2EHS5_9BURK|nr:hypothetical protein [Aquabacterium terrae]NRF68205.1 hypothetical protein [Aquabacterium terrae]